MNRKIWYVISVLFIIFGFLLLCAPKGVRGATSDLTYTFDKDSIYDSNNISYSTFNLRNQTTIAQPNYTATYDFLDENIGANPQDFLVDDGGGSATIIETFNGHNNALGLNDTGADDIILYQYFSENRTNGIIEFWYGTSDATKQYPIYLIDSGGACGIQIDNDKFQYLGASWTNIPNAPTPIDNMWYHIKIIFECGGGGLDGLAPDTFKVFINNVEYGDFPFFASKTNIDWIKIATQTVDEDYVGYFDAIGYSWDVNYTIGQNIAYPETSITEIQEIDKCEFAYNITTLEPNTLASLEIDNNWVENDDGTDAHVQTAGLGDSISIDYGVSQAQNDYGISKEFDYNAENIFNVSFDIVSMALYNPHLDGWYFNIYSYDDTLLVSLLFNLTTPPDIFLYYYDGSNYIELHEIVDSLFSFSFNIYINDRVILSLNDDDVIYNWYFSELTDKVGINTIEVIGGHKDDIGDSAEVDIDSIGLYINGSSYLTDDLSSIIVDTDIEDWDDSVHNMFEVSGNGSFSFSVFYDGSIADVIIPFSVYNMETKRAHYDGGNIFEGSSPYTFVCITNSTFTISEISIYAIVMREGSNTYTASLSSTNVDSEDGYFYVNGGNLYHSCYYDEEEDVEYISISFDIDNIQNVNRSLYYSSYYNGIGVGQLYVNYTSESYSLHEYEPFPTAKNVRLPQNYIIEGFAIVVSDANGTGFTNQTSTGYLHPIKLKYYPDYSLAMATEDLMTVLTPLMIIIVPSFILAKAIDKRFLTIFFMIMSIVCFISGLIPMWLLFVVIMCLGSFMLIKGGDDYSGI